MPNSEERGISEWTAYRVCGRGGVLSSPKAPSGLSPEAVASSPISALPGASLTPLLILSNTLPVMHRQSHCASASYIENQCLNTDSTHPTQGSVGFRFWNRVIWACKERQVLIMPCSILVCIIGEHMQGTNCSITMKQWQNDAGYRPAVTQYRVITVPKVA